MSADRKHASAVQNCPLCKAPASPDYAPFCSRRCRDRDLLGWLGENYRIAGRSTDEDELEKSSDYGDSHFQDDR